MGFNGQDQWAVSVEEEEAGWITLLTVPGMGMEIDWQGIDKHKIAVATMQL